MVDRYVHEDPGVPLVVSDDEITGTLTFIRALEDTDFVRSGVYEDGGISGVMKVAHAAEGFGLYVELHGGGLAHRHCIAAIRNTTYYELGLLNPKIKNTKPPIYPPEFVDELENIGPDGHVPVP